MTTREEAFALAERGAVGRLTALRAVVVHHSATPLSASFEQLERGHRLRGFAMIGYHAVILGDGTLVPGRPLPLEGAHALGRNGDTLGLCIVGDNRYPASRWTDAQLRMARLWLGGLGTVEAGLEVIAHCDVHATLCPGMSTAALRAALWGNP